MWSGVDCKSGKCIQVIDPEKDGMKVSFPCVSCIALDSSESWLVRDYGLNKSRIDQFLLLRCCIYL